MCLHVILPHYSSHPIPSIFSLDKGGGVRFPESFGKTSKAVESGVNVAGITCGAVFHGEAGVVGWGSLVDGKIGTTDCTDNTDFKRVVKRFGLKCRVENPNPRTLLISAVILPASWFHLKIQVD